MFSLATHATRRTLSRQQWTKAASIVVKANYSSGSLSSAIRISSIPAPHTGEITVLSLNRPRARNAISTQLLSELSTIVEQLHAEGDKSTTRALIVASESDDAFCAGADLKERLTFTEEE
jgi:methylglutaconyl-CoA hydratase